MLYRSKEQVFKLLDALRGESPISTIAVLRARSLEGQIQLPAAEGVGILNALSVRMGGGWSHLPMPSGLEKLIARFLEGRERVSVLDPWPGLGQMIPLVQKSGLPGSITVYDTGQLLDITSRYEGMTVVRVDGEFVGLTDDLSSKFDLVVCHG